MKSKIFRRSDNTYTLLEFEESDGVKIQNQSVIPPKYSPTEKAANLRRKSLNSL